MLVRHWVLSPSRGTMSTLVDPAKQIVVFGEILFDCFGEALRLGGAPLNVAWHLHGFGLAPLLISRIGEDNSGERARQQLARWGLDLRGVQRDPNYPTGRVIVRLDRGQPRFEILPNQAFDHIHADEALRAAGQSGTAAIVYHGTLAVRQPASLAALKVFHKNLCAPRFIDVNLRAPWWDRNIVLSLIEGARCVKVSEEELRHLDEQGGKLDKAAAAFRQRLHIQTLLLTRGGQGAFGIDETGFHQAVAPPAEPFVDTVGAGDAFCSVALIGLLRGWGLAATLERATAFASRVCGIAGAISEDRELYCTIDGGGG